VRRGRRGLVECWGGNGEGALATPFQASGDENVPTPISCSDGGVVVPCPSMSQVAEGVGHTCAVAADGVSLWCWGY